jgi:hypothetical protein
MQIGCPLNALGIRIDNRDVVVMGKVTGDAGSHLA